MHDREQISLGSTVLAGLALVWVVDPMTAHQVVGIIMGMECEMITPPQLSSVGDTGNMRV